jgi:transcriptional regulator with XRE-family HTH domain
MADHRPISDESDFADPGPSLGEMLRFARLNCRRVSLRSLARETGVSAGQLSRIESGETTRPAIKTLLALAPALDLHPSLLFALAGHLDPYSARRELAALVDESRDELIEEYDDAGDYADELLARAEALRDDDAVRDLAMELATLVTRPVGNPPELVGLAPSGAGDRPLLTDVIARWEQMSPDRRWRLHEIAKDFAVASATASKEADR